MASKELQLVQAIIKEGQLRLVALTTGQIKMSAAEVKVLEDVISKNQHREAQLSGKKMNITKMVVR